MSSAAPRTEPVPGESLSLEGRSALITGASRGIGLAIALLFVAAGARTFLLARSANALETAAKTEPELPLEQRTSRSYGAARITLFNR